MTEHFSLTFSQTHFVAAIVLVSCVAKADQAIEEIRVTGERNLLNQSLYVDGSQQTITLDQQVSLNRTVGDLIERLPGVSLNGQGGLFQSYSVRGFSRWRIRTEVDGVPVVTDRRAGNSASFIPPELLSGVTVSQGPGSSLYGSDAMGGIVSLNTIQPQDIEATVEAQDNDKAVAATVGLGLGEAGSAAVSLRRADEAEDAEGRELNTGYEQMGMLLKSQFAYNEYDVSVTWLPSYGRDIGKSTSDYPQRVVSDYPEDIHSLFSVQVQDGSQWLGRLYHHYQDWQARTERVGVRTNITDYDSHTVGGLAYAATHFLSGIGRAGLEWVGRRGVSIEDKEFDPSGSLVAKTQVIDGEQDNYAVFVENQWQVGMLSYGGALRYDYIEQDDTTNTRSDSSVSASVSSSWAPQDTLEITGQIGTGFRFPTLTELYFNGATPRGETIGNPELEPEENLGVQLGLYYDAGVVSASLQTYYNQLDQYIERYAVDAKTRSYRNLDGADIWGFEAQFSWQPDASLTHSISYQWQRGESDTGDWLADLNPSSFRYLLDWRGQVYRMQSDLSYRLNRNDFGEGEMALDSVLIWNGRLIRYFGDSWQGEIFANNILDELYVATADEDAAYQPGRTLGLRIRWNAK